MKNRYHGLGVFLLAGTLLCGCSSGSSSTTERSDVQQKAQSQPESSSVTHACTAELMEMKATVTMTAPSDTSEVSSIQMVIDMPATYFGLETFDTLADQTEQIKELIVEELSKELELPESDLSATTSADNLTVTIQLNKDNQRRILGLDDKASTVMTDMIKALEEGNEAICD